MGFKARARKATHLYVWRETDLRIGYYALSAHEPTLDEHSWGGDKERTLASAGADSAMYACPENFEAATGIKLAYSDGVRRVRATFELEDES